MKFFPIPMSILAAFCATIATAQEIDRETVQQVSTHLGEMTSTIDAGSSASDESITFEPYQMTEDIFTRGDLVFLMRHGPTDWSKRDEPNVAPTDCDNQRVMTDEGVDQMTAFGEILASNGIIPSQIVVSEWCRNLQTVRAIQSGIGVVDIAELQALPVVTDAEINLLLSGQGAKDVSSLRSRISSWEGDPDRPGPLLIVTHYTNIEELTQFRVFEGEALVIDPKLDNRVVGYIRLKSAGPDEGHFADALSSPLIEGNPAFQMIDRYYAALSSQDMDTLEEILADGWVTRGLSDGVSDQNVTGFLERVDDSTSGLTERRFVIEDIHVTDDVVTVIGEITGVHSGEVFGVAATGNQIAFGAIAVHRLSDGQIVESWQIADRVSLIQQLTE